MTSHPYIQRALLWLETALQTDIRYILRGGYWNIIGQFGSTASALAVSVAVGHYVDKDIYGTYKFVLSVISIMGLVSLNSMGAAVFQSVARGFDGALSEGFRLTLRWGLLTVAGAVAAASYYVLAGNLGLALAILMGGTLAPFMGASSLYLSFLAGKKDFARQSLYGGLLGNVFPSIIMIGAALWWPTFTGLMLAYFGGNLASDFYFYFRTRAIYKPDDSKRDPHMLNYAKHLSVQGIIGGVSSALDQILIFHFAGAAALATYVFAIGLPDQSKGFVKGADTMLQARFAPGKSANIHSSMANKILWATVMGIAATIGYILIAPLLYNVLFPRYVDSILYSQIYALSIIFVGIVPIQSYISAKKIVRMQYVLVIGSSLFRILAVTIGAIMYGIWGVIIARILTNAWIAALSAGLYINSRSETSV